MKNTIANKKKDLRYTQVISKVGVWARRLLRNFVRNERPLPRGKARVRTEFLCEADAVQNQLLNSFVYTL